MPSASSCTANRREKVVLPEEDGPEIKTKRSSSCFSAIWRAISAMCCSCKASETKIISRARPAAMVSFNAPTELMPSVSSQPPYSRNAANNFGNSSIGESSVGLWRRGNLKVKPPLEAAKPNHCK